MPIFLLSKNHMEHVASLPTRTFYSTPCGMKPKHIIVYKTMFMKRKGTSSNTHQENQLDRAT